MCAGEEGEERGGVCAGEGRRGIVRQVVVGRVEGYAIFHPARGNVGTL